MTTLRLPQVKAKTGLSKSRIYALIKTGLFPRPGKTGKASVWREDEIDAWIQALLNTRGSAYRPHFRLPPEDYEPTLRVVSRKVRRVWKLEPWLPRVYQVQEGVSYVYFLVKGVDVVYVGRSDSPARRVAGHRRDKDFDYACYMAFGPEEVDCAESFFIHTLQPRLNRAGIAA